MEKYEKFSYEPIRLRIGLSGVRGINNEPINVINNLIDQNILALAYSEPLTISEISEKLGVSAAFVEEAVENLLENEFMGQKGNKFFTDFLIIDEEIKTEKIKAQKEFANETFSDVKNIFYDLYNQLKSDKYLNSFNDTQLFLFTVLNIRKYYFQYLMDALKLMKHENFPERPNNGKWVICCEKVKTKTSDHELTISGILSSTLPNGLRLEEYDTTIGRTHLANYSIFISINERIELLYSIHTKKEIDPIKLPLIHDFKNLGFISDDKDNRKKLCIPVISVKENERINELIGRYGKLFIEKIGEKLTQFVKKNVVKYPKQIRNVSNNAYLLTVEVLPLAYAFKVADDGIITIDKNINYPVSVLIENTLLTD